MTSDCDICYEPKDTFVDFGCGCSFLTCNECKSKFIINKNKCPQCSHKKKTCLERICDFFRYF